MPIYYNSKSIIPAPLVDINKSYQRNGSNEMIGTLFSLTVTGTILPDKGSPSSSGTFHTTSGYPADESIVSDSKMAAIIRKQDALRELFSEDGHSFEIQPLDGTQPIKCNPRVISINFPQGTWATRCEYTISLEAELLYPQSEDTFTQYLSDAQESWTIDSNEQAENEVQQTTLRLSHTVSAVGKRFYNAAGTIEKQPWEYAQEYVLARLGFDSTILLSSGVHNLPAYYAGYNLVRSSNRDESNGAFNATESWLIASGTALEEFTIETVSNVQDPLKRTTINGNITGLEQRDNNYNVTTTKWTNASSKFAIASGLALTRAQNYSGYTFNIVPVNTSVGRNPVTGTISYSFEYDDRPSNIVSGALSEVISIVDNYQTNTVGVVPVIGRARGPVLQNIGTSEATTRQLSIELVMPRATFNNNSLSDLQSALFSQRPTAAVSGIVDAANPNGFGATKVYITNHTENWEPKTGRYSKQISWIYE